MRRTLKIWKLFFISFYILSCNSKIPQEFPQAPEFPTTQWVFSEPVLLSKLRGKIVLLSFWTYSCVHCIQAISELQRLEEKWKNELVIIGIHSGRFPNEHNLQNLKNAVYKYKIQHPVINDSNFEIWQSYGIQTWPSFVLIDPFGRIVARKIGEGVFQNFDPLIQKLVSEFDIRKEFNHKNLYFNKKFESHKGYLYFPEKLTISSSGRELYISNSGANNIFVIHTYSGTILQIIGSTEGFSDGTFSKAKFSNPQGLYYQSENLFIADNKNHAIRKVDLKNQKVFTITKNLDKKEENLARSPLDLSLRDNELFIAMAGNDQIWKLSKHSFQPFIGSGIKELGDENRKNARLAKPSAITILENKIYFLDSEASALRVYDIQEDKVNTLIGKGLFQVGDVDGKKETALMQHPTGLAFGENKIFIADTFNHKIKFYDLNNQALITLAGNGKAEFKDGDLSKASFNEPSGLVYWNGILYVADTNNHSIRMIDLQAKKVETMEIFYSEKLALEKLNATNEKLIALPEEEISSDIDRLFLQWELENSYEWRNKNSFLILKSKNPKVMEIKLNSVIPFQKEMEIPVQVSNGESSIQISVLLDYCQKENRKFCMTENLRFIKRYKIKKTGKLKPTLKINVPFIKGD